jgi:hypothetical protein
MCSSGILYFIRRDENFFTALIYNMNYVRVEYREKNSFIQNFAILQSKNIFCIVAKFLKLTSSPSCCTRNIFLVCAILLRLSQKSGTDFFSKNKIKYKKMFCAFRKIYYFFVFGNKTTAQNEKMYKISHDNFETC